MWYLDNVYARNICSFCELEYTLQQGVTTLIFGHNADNENQKSNGSGKSTLIEAIAFGITGSPLRKVRSEEIINDGAEECSVRLCLGNRANGEVLTIEREIYRKGTSNVRCTLRCDGKDVDVAQASVDAYNKYILDKLGISRDELFSSFILSKHRYQDFLSSSDKDKKEIINRFSNGILVDQAIQNVEADLEPLQQRLKDADMDFAGIEGRIEMLCEQIRTEEDSRQEKERSKKEKIEDIKATIAQKRTGIRDSRKNIDTLAQVLNNTRKMDEQIQKMEDSDQSLGDCMVSVKEILALLTDCKLTDWTQIIATKNREIANALAEIEKWTTIIATVHQKIACTEADFIALQSQYKVFETESDVKSTELKTELQALKDRLCAANDQVEELHKKKRDNSAAIESLKAKLAGKVTCPSCKHEFLVSDESFDVTGAQARLGQKQADLEQVNERLLDNQIEVEKVEMMITAVRNEGREIEGFKEQWKDRMAKGERAVQAAEYEMEGARFNFKRIQDFVTARTKEIDDMRRSLFDEAYDCLDSAKRINQRKVTENEEQISAAESAIEILQQTISEMETSTVSEIVASLKESLKTYRKQSSLVLEQKAALEAQIGALNTQQQVFVQFKSFLANSKIEALSSMMNLILSDMGSDIRISMSGYTVLKSGVMREKISVSILRDGIDIGSFGKCSAGEAARVNLSSLLAMQRLVNGNADFGKGLDLLVLDEILEAVDESGLATIFGSLNKLGITSLIVSHGLVNEGYPHKLLIVKENGESHIHNK